MEEDLMLIKRKDGIEYYRRKKETLNIRINIRISENTLNELKEIAEKKGIKYNALIRNVLEEYVENYNEEV